MIKLRVRLITLFFLCISLCSISTVKASIGEEIIAPVTNNDARVVLILGASTTLIASLFKKTLIKQVQHDVHKKQFLCCKKTAPGNTYLQILPNALYSLAEGLHYYFSENEDSKRQAWGMAKATIYSGLLTDLIKPIVNESRPNGGALSFPSGHTTTAFAFASFIASEHPWYVGAPAYLLATYVGYCRMQDNFHYLHDVMAGATIGMSYGIALSLNSRKEKDEQSAFFLTPIEGLKGLAFKYAPMF
jgi:hypothetical protein